MPLEAWRAIVGYEGLYEISSIGRVKSLPSYATCRGGGRRLVAEKILRTFVDRGGYSRILLNKKGRRRFSVHRLVAFAFLGAPPGKGMHVDHINRDTSDNRAENLRWVTPLENALNRSAYFKSGSFCDACGSQIKKARLVEYQSGP
jgi:hypothetical protein